MSLVFSCGSILLLFNWLCQKINDSATTSPSPARPRHSSHSPARPIDDSSVSHSTQANLQVPQQNNRNNRMSLSQILHPSGAQSNQEQNAYRESEEQGEPEPPRRREEAKFKCKIRIRYVKLTDLGLLILYLIVSLNGLTFSLIVILIAFFDFINHGTISITAGIEVMAYFIIMILLSCFSMRQLSFWTQSYFMPRVYDSRIATINKRLEQFQREQERLAAESSQSEQAEEAKDKMDTLQENLTKVQMDQIEDMPFSRYLVKISNSYYQTIGKFTKQLLQGAKNLQTPKGDKEGRHPSKKQFMQKYKKNTVKLHSIKNVKAAKQGKKPKESIDMMTIPEEQSSRQLSTRRIGRQSKRSFQAVDIAPLSVEERIEEGLSKRNNLEIIMSELDAQSRNCLTSNKQSRNSFVYSFKNTKKGKQSPIGKAWKEEIDDQLLDEKKLVDKLEDIQLEFDSGKKDKSEKRKKKKARCHSADSLFKYSSSEVATVQISHRDVEKDSNGKQYEKFVEKERQIQVSLNECMLCLTEISNCVLMECGHSNICFNCTMRLAIKNRAEGKQPYCHLCRKVIKFALKIEVPSEVTQEKTDIKMKEYSPDDKQNFITPKGEEKKEQQSFVKILSFVDMEEAKPRRENRRRVIPKFKEIIITDDTKWIYDDSDFTGLMNEFYYQEKPFSKTQKKQKKGKKLDVKQYLDYLVEEDVVLPEDYDGEDMEDLIRQKEELRIREQQERMNNKDTFFNQVITRYQLQPKEGAHLQWGKRGKDEMPSTAREDA